MSARVVAAARAYADTGAAKSPPPSLRVYAMAKRLPGIMAEFDVLEEDGLLWAELEVYAAEEARAQAEAHARANRRSAAPSGSRRGLFRRSRG